MEVVKLHSSHFAELEQFEKSYIEESQQFTYLLNKDGYCGYVAKVDSQIVGYCILQETNIDAFDLIYIYVRECDRNKGFASAMLSFIIADLNPKIWTLEVDNRNEHAKRLYQTVGFYKVTTRKGYYNGNDGLLMMYERGDNK